MSPPDDAARAERLAAALRANLRRRKAQAKGRVASPGDARAEDAGSAREDAPPAEEAEDGAKPAR